MRVKKVNRYYCDYCKKSNCSKHAMEIHEKHCTMNPNRKCRLCDDVTAPEKLIALLPDPKECTWEDEWDSIVWAANSHELIEDSMKKIRDITDCPACIMSALRQRGIPVMMVSSFNYREESEQYLKEKHMDWNECY